MGLPRLVAAPCLSPPKIARDPHLAAVNVSRIAHGGLLKYQSKGAVWKERWFVLDSADYRLVKCKSSDGQQSKSRQSVLGSGKGIRIAEVVGLSSARERSGSDEPGLDVVTSTGQRIRFLAKTPQDELQWMEAMQKLSHGFTRGVCDRLAERELLAGKYALVRELGRGASGVVYLYTYKGKPFAIKKFVPQKAKGIPNRLAVPGIGSSGIRRPNNQGTQDPHSNIPENIRREIALLKKASHLPYVIQLHDVIVNSEERQYFIVMEYMGGGTIAEWDAERKCYACARNQKSMNLLEKKTVRAYMTNLLLGIQALHQNGLCHRDIKPENLMANDERTICKIGDLGVAHYFRQETNGEYKEEVDSDQIALWDVTAGTDTAREQKTGGLTQGGPPSSSPRKAMLKTTKGTYQFLPPEALSGDEFDGFKADIWAIGVTLYALLFGYLPFFSTDLVKLFEKIERDPVEFPTTCQDEEVKDLLLRILEKNPDKRISIEQILQHCWLHRHVDSKALTQQVRALKRHPALCVDAGETGEAVSVLQTPSDKLSRAVHNDSLQEVDHDRTGQPSDTVATNKPFSPRAIVTTGIQLPGWMECDLSVLAAQLHYDWCRAKYLDGWTLGIDRDDVALVHPLLVPMRDLPENARLKNVQCAEETLKCVLALGCHVDKQSSNKLKHSASDELLPVAHAFLPWDMVMLVDLLAENSHQVWAAGYVELGWRYGDTFDAESKTHPSLKPYMALEEADKNLCREGVNTVLKSCICLGYTFSCSREAPKQKRSNSKWSAN